MTACNLQHAVKDLHHLQVVCEEYGCKTGSWQECNRVQAYWLHTCFGLLGHAVGECDTGLCCMQALDAAEHNIDEGLASYQAQRHPDVLALHTLDLTIRQRSVDDLIYFH